MTPTLSYDDALVRWVIELDAVDGPTTALTTGDVTLYAAQDRLTTVVVNAPLDAFDPDGEVVAAVQQLIGPVDLRRARARRFDLAVSDLTEPVRRAVALAVTAYVDDPSSYDTAVGACPDEVRRLLPSGTRARAARPALPASLVTAWTSSPGVIDVVVADRPSGDTVAGTTWLTPHDDVVGVLDVGTPAQVVWQPSIGQLSVRVRLAEGAVPDDVAPLWMRIARADDGLTVAAAPLVPDGDVADAVAALADDDLRALTLDVTETPFVPAGTARDRRRAQAVALMQLAVDLGDDPEAGRLWAAAEALFVRLGDDVRAAACRRRAAADVAATDAPANRAPAVDEASTGGAPLRRRRWPFLVVGLAVTAGAAALLVRDDPGPRSSTTIASAPAATSATSAPRPTPPAPPTTIPADSTTLAPRPLDTDVTRGDWVTIDGTELALRFPGAAVSAGSSVPVELRLTTPREHPYPGDGSFDEELTECPRIPTPGLTSGADLSEPVVVEFWLLPADAPLEGLQPLDDFDATLVVADAGMVEGVDGGLSSCVEEQRRMADDGGLAVLFSVTFGPVDATIDLPADLAAGDYVLVPVTSDRTTSLQWSSGEPLRVTVGPVAG